MNNLTGKQFLIAYGIALIVSIPRILESTSTSELLELFLYITINAIVFLIIINIFIWVGKKMGMGKKK